MNKHLIKALIGIFILTVSVKLNAQKPAFETGKHIPPPEAKKKKNRYSRLYASTNDEFFVSDRIKDGSVVTTYNPLTLKKEGTFTLKNPEVNGHDANWFKRYFNGEEITSIYAYYDKKEDKNYIYGKITNRENKSIVKEKVLVSFPATKKKFIGDVGIVRSADKSKFLIYREPTSKNSPQESIDLWLYDDQLDKIYKKKLKFPYKNKDFIVQDYLLTDSGKVIIVAYFTPSKDEIKNGGAASFKVFGVTVDNEELEEIKITPKGKALSSAFGWILDSGNSIAFTGFYRDDKKNKGANGIFYVKINANAWEEEITSFNKISEEDMNKIFVGSETTERAKKRAKKSVDRGYGLNRFLLKDIYFDNDGNIKIVTQLEYMVERCNTDQRTGRTTCVYYYYNMSIVEFDLNSEGKIIKSIVIPKKQLVTDRPASVSVGFFTYSFSLSVVSVTNYLGHIVLATPTKLYYIYNDNDKNFNKKQTDKHKGNNFYYYFNNSKKSRLVYASNSDKKGKAVKTAMTSSYKDNITILPDADVIKMADGSVIVWGKIRKSNELILMRFYLKEKGPKD